MKPYKIQTRLPFDSSQVAKTRNLGGKRCVRFSVSIANDYDAKLSKLAISCGMPKSKLADLLIRLTLDSPHMVEMIQDVHNKNEKYRVKPMIVSHYGVERIEFH